MEQILILEDDTALNQGLCKALKTESRKLVSCETVKAARDQFLCGCPSLILLDINLPDGSGLDFLQELKRNYPDIPVILLTANDTDMDIVKGLELGADDYITKPFSPSELTARVDAIYRRVCMSSMSDKQKSVLKSGPFVLNLVNRTLHKQEKPIELTQIEYQVLEYFLKNKNTALDRSSILQHIWGEQYDGDDKIVDVNIRRIRMKIEDQPSNPKYITTIWGYGYKWNDK